MERASLEGIGPADEWLGRRVPLPSAALPLTRWVEVVTNGEGAVQVEWNFDVSRPESQGRMTLYVGTRPPPERGLPEARREGRYAYRHAPLVEAAPEFKPVQELAWEHDGLYLRLTGQGPWVLTELVALADSVI